MRSHRPRSARERERERERETKGTEDGGRRKGREGTGTAERMVGTLFTPIGEWNKLHDRLYR